MYSVQRLGKAGLTDGFLLLDKLLPLHHPRHRLLSRHSPSVRKAVQGESTSRFEIGKDTHQGIPDKIALPGFCMGAGRGVSSGFDAGVFGGNNVGSGAGRAVRTQEW